MLEEDMNARLIDVRIAQRQIEHRIAWENISRFERLERAFKSARSKMSALPTLSARTN